MAPLKMRATATSRSVDALKLIRVLSLISLIVLGPTHAYSQNESMTSAQDAVRAHDYTKAAHVYAVLAEQGNAEAMYQLGVLFQNGRGVDRDDRRALTLFSQAAQKGHVKASYSVGESYEYGRGTDVNNASAVAWYERAAQLGDDQAANKLKSIKVSGAMGNTIQLSVTDRLMEAATRGNLDGVTRALDAGADINMHDTFGNTPLSIAVTRKNPPAVELLLKRNADPNIRGASGDTPLIIAAQKDEEVIAQELLDSGADVDSTDTYSNTALMAAVKRHNIAFTKLLLKHNADPARYNKNRQNALLLARAAGFDDLVSLLLATGKVTLPKELEHSQEAIDAVVSNLQNDNGKQGSSNWPPLVMTAMRGQVDVAQSLIAEGADINAVAPDGFTALAVAAKRGDKPMLELLLAHKASVSASTNEDTSPLVVAAGEGRPEIVERLIPYYKNSESLAPLIYKAFNKSMLAGHGDCATILAQNSGQLQVDGSSINNTIFLRAAEIGETNLAKMLHIPSDRINVTNKEGVTALMLAAAGGHKDFIDFLIANHANLNLRNKRGWTALIFAMDKNKLDAALQLINAGADPSISTNENGFTPIMMAATHDQAALIQEMIAHGASVHGLNWKNDTALSIAIQRHSMNSIKVLLENGADPYQPYEVIEDMPSDIDQIVRSYWTTKGWIYKLFDFSKKG